MLDDVSESFFAILERFRGVFSCNVEKHRVRIVGGDVVVQRGKSTSTDVSIKIVQVAGKKAGDICPGRISFCAGLLQVAICSSDEGYV